MTEHLFCPWCGGVLARAGGAQRCTACGVRHHRDPKVGVGVVAHDDQGRLLLVQRGNSPGKGLWSLPAGYVDAEEDPRAAAARECLEETGLVADVSHCLDVYPSSSGGASFFLAFRATIVGGVARAGDDATDVGWFAPEALPELAFESTWAAVRASRAL